MILGPTGAGKSTLLATVAAQFQRYDTGQIFFLDNGKSIYPLCQALDNSVFYDLGQAANNINLCPLAQIDDPEVMSWAAEWLEMLIEMVAPGLVTPARRILLNDALKNFAASTSCATERTLTEYITSVQDEDMKHSTVSISRTWVILMFRSIRFMAKSARIKKNSISSSRT